MNYLRLALRNLFLRRKQLHKRRKSQKLSFELPLPSMKEEQVRYITLGKIQIGRPIRTRGNKLN